MFALSQLPSSRYIKRRQHFFVEYSKSRLVFTLEEEEKITEHLPKCTDIYFGSEVEKLAYHCPLAIAIKINLPS